MPPLPLPVAYTPCKSLWQHVHIYAVMFGCVPVPGGVSRGRHLPPQQPLPWKHGPSSLGGHCALDLYLPTRSHPHSRSRPYLHQEIEKKRRLEQQLICKNPPFKRRCVQSEAFVRDASLESIDLV